MPSPTIRNGFRKPDPGSDNNTWGSNLNLSVFDLVDSAIDGWTTITASLTGTTTLTATQYVSNQARQRCLHYTGVTSETIIIPSVEKNYIVWAENGDVTITTGSLVTAVIKAGDIANVICDGTDCYKVQFNDFAGQEIINIAEVPTTNGSAASKAYVDGIAFQTTGALPGQNVGTTYKATFSDGSNAAWRRALPQSVASTAGKFLKSTATDGYPEDSSAWAWDGFQGSVGKSSAYTIALTDRDKLILCTSTFTLGVTAALTLGNQFHTRIVNSGSGKITIDPNGSETIQVTNQTALTSFILYPGDVLDLYCDGSNFQGVLTHTGTGTVFEAYEGGVSGTNGGSAAGLAQVPRIVNNIVRNDLGVTVNGSGSIQSVPRGTYRVNAVGYSIGTATNKLRIRDTTNNVSLVVGGNAYAADLGSGYLLGSAATVFGSFTLTGSVNLELQHRISNSAPSGGTPTFGNAASTGDPEIYAYIRLERVGP